MPAERPLRMGLIGAGFMGAVHSRAVRAAGGRLHAVAASSPERSARAARELAQANGVGLWQADELARLRRCAEQGTAPPPELLPGRAGYGGQKPKSAENRG